MEPFSIAVTVTEIDRTEKNQSVPAGLSSMDRWLAESRPHLVFCPRFLHHRYKIPFPETGL